MELSLLSIKVAGKISFPDIIIFIDKLLKTDKLFSCNVSIMKHESVEYFRQKPTLAKQFPRKYSDVEALEGFALGPQWGHTPINLAPLKLWIRYTASAFVSLCMVCPFVSNEFP